MKYIGIVFFISFFIGCVQQEKLAVKEKTIEKIKLISPKAMPKTKEIKLKVKDLLHVPQDVSYYTKDINTSILYDTQTKYEESYFSVWNISKPPKSLNDIKWPFRSFTFGKSYGENLLPLKKEFFNIMLKKSNFKDYALVNKKGLTLRYSNIRALPTDKPILRDPSLAGEGFPFDYLQNSSVNANTPLFISHYSSDKQWVYVFSSFTYGWLKTNEVVFIDDSYASTWQNAQQVFVTQEGVPLYTQNNKPLFDTRIGNIFALIEENDISYTILTVSSLGGTQAMYHKTRISKDFASKQTLALNPENINKIIKEVSKTNYGWGGVYGQRDCSSTLMDFYTPFGLWLPRNSSKQSLVGDVLKLDKLDAQAKVKLIKKNAIPFQTLLYKKGHIVLYAGTYKDQIVVFQNVWGVHTLKDGKKGRFIIGKPVFSTLKLGSELKYYDERSELLKNLRSMNTLTR